MSTETKHTPDDLLARLDRVGVHQSVAARYCKEAAAEIRRLHAQNDAAPDLLAALKDAQALVNRLPQVEWHALYRPDGSSITAQQAFRNIADAIAKAEGRS